MWDNHRLLNGIANGLYAVAALLLLYGVLMVIMRLPIFPLREVEVSGRVAHTTRDQVQAIVAEQLKGNFFTLDLERARGVRETALGAQGECAPAVARPAGGRDRGARRARALARQRAGEHLRRGVRSGEQ